MFLLKFENIWLKLRICPKKRQIDRSNEDEYNIDWSWLERWMATSVPDDIQLEHQTNIQGDVRRTGPSVWLESWRAVPSASNDLPLQFESISEKLEEETESLQREKSSVKASISNRKSVSNYKSQRMHNRVKTKPHKSRPTKTDMQRKPRPD